MANDARETGFAPGPLDELAPGLRAKSDKLPALPVHPRIVRAQRNDGTHDIVLLSFRGAESARGFHAGLKPMIEAALLSELSVPKEQLAEAYSRPQSLTLVSFAHHTLDLTPALAPFALSAHTLGGADDAHMLALARREALMLDAQVPDEPTAAFRADVIRSQHPLAEDLHRALLEYAPGGAFGQKPGLLSRVAADWLDKQAGFPGVCPSRAGIERLEEVVVSTRAGAIRWIEPLAFQALCDLVAVYAASREALRVEWGVSEPDESGLAPPPMLRVHRDADTFHVPIGEHVLRWCIMPTREAEEIPSLGAWAEHEFQ